MSTAGSVVHFASAIYTLLDPGDPRAEGRYVAEDFLALSFDCVQKLELRFRARAGTREEC